MAIYDVLKIRPFIQSSSFHFKVESYFSSISTLHIVECGSCVDFITPTTGINPQYLNYLPQAFHASYMVHGIHACACMYIYSIQVKDFWI